MTKLLSQQDVIDYLQVTRQTIYVWRRQEIFPKPFQVGRFLRWKQEDIEKFASQHTAAI
ncbi:helix-turn-helix transcriptional regulator [Undibacterium sp. Di26W]|uniref:helix-turn-helix transcriptional regulator n=1 Tax=Undibacterium sp. Di26W TaxID=3413035 RepID=UPI003BF2C486